MDKIIHRSASRGYADYGWLQTYHTFSFAGYRDERRMRFGMLRVLNDDTVAPAMGFDTHPHKEMEIVSVPLAGWLRHADSMGHSAVLHEGQIQTMTAGTGILHSEFNASDDGPVKFLQIWILPERTGLEPRYEDITLDTAVTDRPRLIVAPEGHGRKGVGTIHQDAWLHTLDTSDACRETYTLRDEAHGAYLFVIEGEARAAGELLTARDGMGVWNAREIPIETDMRSKLLIIEVPM